MQDKKTDDTVRNNVRRECLGFVGVPVQVIIIDDEEYDVNIM